ncbi:MAG: hypothetical protein GY822_02005 [Deltaproteobacteria bacterium]|nr:hypothetical protein [Deltaproteobacteria bacterium]
MQLFTSAFYAGLLGIFYVAISYVVTTHRHRTKVGLGISADEALQRAVRIHGNFSEYVPFALLLLAIAELNGFPSWGIHIFGGTLLFARIFHALGIHSSSGVSRNRWWGTALTFTVVSGLGVVNVVLFVRQMLSQAGS